MIRLALILLFACGGGKGGGPIGGDCETDADCPSNLCWDFNDYDSLCGGTVCSKTCSSNSECITAAEAAGADSPDRATCIEDGTCDLVGTGLGSFVCALQ